MTAVGGDREEGVVVGGDEGKLKETNLEDEEEHGDVGGASKKGAGETRYAGIVHVLRFDAFMHTGIILSSYFGKVYYKVYYGSRTCSMTCQVHNVTRAIMLV